ncbi:hypothetical protein IVA78_27480 [Bradyrhizobium sp. 137]|nr:hypothetical protein [Bradyrhizobium sp. 137]MCK1758810.1 hypothetical protein [Bradyrhizobium sp. 137]
MLRRILAVNWAFTRLRPPPHSGSVDAAPGAADSPAPIIDIAEAAPARVTDVSAEPLHDNSDLAVTAPVAENDTAVSVDAESPSTGIRVEDASSPETLTGAEAISTFPAVEDASASSADVEHDPVLVPDLVIVSETCSEVPAAVEPVVAAKVSLSSAEVETPLTSDKSSPSASTAVADQIPAVVVDTISIAADVPETRSGSAPCGSAEIASAAANDAPLATAVATEVPSACSLGAITNIEPAPAVVSASPEIRSARKVRARPAEPTDRAALIRQRWAETGIRMWNPRLHGTGDATLNIQGSVGLLPPATGETMPRYDKLEFKMLGGQIICEGVTVEAPAHASQRSFTRLAEPSKHDRAREPVRERQAALA